jgi:Pentapeptide repeats (8 copies)
LAAVLTAANLFNANLSGAQLTGADLSYVYLYGLSASLPGATMNLAGMDLSAVQDKQMQGATFTGACLVNCNCKGTNFTDYDGKAASLSKACLQGVDFSDATLFGAVLVDAAVALKAGTLEVTLIIGGKPVKFPVEYDPTTIPENSTNELTKCPDHENGPCAGSKLNSPNAPMNAWPSTDQLRERAKLSGLERVGEPIIASAGDH